MSIEEALLEIEARRFAGRKSELSALHAILSRAGSAAAVGYVHGPEGMGKTALLRAFAREVKDRVGTRSVLVEMRRSSLNADTFYRHLASLIDIPYAQHAGPETLVSGIRAIASRGGLVLLLDDYDALGADEPAIRESLIYRLPPRTALVLTGRRAPAALWPLAHAWRRFVTSIPLQSLPRDEADEVFTAHGIRSPELRREAYAVTSGHPAMLGHVLELLPHDEVAAAAEPGMHASPVATGDRDLPRFLIEQLVHPGSRRREWRPGSGENAMDTVLAAAALVPVFNRELLRAMVGARVADEAWEGLMRLPTQQDVNGWCRLAPGLRARLAPLVLRQRPWLGRVWIHRALRHCLDRPGSGHDRTAVNVALRLWAESAAPWATRGEGAPHGVVRWGPRQGAPVLPWPELSQLAERLPERSLLLEDGHGNLLGAATLAQAEDIPSGTLRIPDYQSRTVVVIIAASAPTAIGPLFGELGGLIQDAKAILLMALGWPGETLEAVGFTREGADWWRLDLSVMPFAQWLRRVAVPLRAAPYPEDPTSLAKEVLQGLSAGVDLKETAAGRILRAIDPGADPEDVRKWVLDALESADLGHVPCSGRNLLTAYYVHRMGSHEEIAEWLNLPRATYFRAYRQALSQFGIAIAGSAG